MNGPHAALDEKRIQGIDRFLRSGAKAKVMEPNAPLIEIVFSIRFRRTSDSDRRSPSNHVQAIRSLHNRLHAHETQHVFIERHGPLEIIDRELYVSDSIDLDHWGSPAASSCAAHRLIQPTRPMAQHDTCPLSCVKRT
jgi:hypothetical protein